MRNGCDSIYVKVYESNLGMYNMNVNVNVASKYPVLYTLRW
jgi:hypothetical protein